jgi:hypothetical protein
MNASHLFSLPRFSTALSTALLCVLAASCGGTADPAKLTDEGYAALGKSDWKGAQADFDAALQQMQTTDAGYLRAKMGSIEALIYTQPERAKDDFLALAKGMSSQVKASDYITVAGKLAGNSKFPEAIAVLEAGLAAHPEHPKVREVGDKIKVLATKAGDSKALDALKGLGYTD